MVEELDYTNAESSGQSILWDIFKKDSAFKALTTNVLDKEPEDFNKGTGYPLFIIPLAQTSDDPIGLRKHGLILYFNCALYTLTVPTMRIMQKAVKTVISSNRNALRLYGLNNATVESRFNPFPLDDGRMAYRADVIIRMKTVVNGSLDD
jgi:hypothetical protein